MAAVDFTNLLADVSALLDDSKQSLAETGDAALDRALADLRIVGSDEDSSVNIALLWL